MTAGKDYGDGAQLLLQAEGDPLQGGGGPVEGAAAHAGHSIGTQQSLGLGKSNARELGSPGTEGVHRQAQPRENHAAPEYALPIHHRQGGGGAHVKDRQRGPPPARAATQSTSRSMPRLETS